MPVAYCPACGIANAAYAESCQACGRALKPDAGQAVSSARFLSQTTFSEPAYVAQERSRHAKAATRALFGAAAMSCMRGMLMPYLIAHTPAHTFGSVDPTLVQLNSYYAAIAFAIAAMWAMREPLLPSVAAISLYVGLALPDLLNGGDFLSRGVISKSVMILVLSRALIAAILHRITRYTPRDRVLVAE